MKQGDVVRIKRSVSLPGASVKKNTTGKIVKVISNPVTVLCVSFAGVILYCPFGILEKV